MVSKSDKNSNLMLKKKSINKPYPWLKVLIGFGLLGGWVGANVIVFTLFLFESFLRGPWQGFDFQYFIENIFEGLVVKMTIGLLPALITAGIVIYIKLYLRTFRGWLALGLLGFVVTIPFSLIAMTMVGSVDFELFLLAILVGVSGLLSAIAIGGLTIPKS